MYPRIMYNNLINDEDFLTASSDRSGIVTNVLKEGSGSAVMQALGDYTGNLTNQYTIEIDSIAGGYEIGEATFKWQDSFGNGASGIATSASETALNYGVTVQFVAGSGDDFALGDKWWFKAINYFRVGQAINYDRDTRYRSATLDAPNYIVIDFGQTQTCNVFCLIDHNFTDGATITLQANSSDLWGSPPFEETLTVDGNTICHFFDDATYRYWRLVMSDDSNPYGYIEVGEVFLGTYLDIPNYAYGDGNDRKAIVTTNSVLGGVERDTYYNEDRFISLDLVNPTKDDRTNLWTMFDAIKSRVSNYIHPVFLYIDSELYYVKILEIQSKSKTYNAYSIPLDFKEVLTTR